MLTQKVYGYVAWVASKDNFIQEYQYATSLNSTIYFVVSTDDGIEYLETTVCDMPRMAVERGLRAAFKRIEHEIPLYWEDENDSK